MKIKYLNLILPFFGALVGGTVSVYAALLNVEAEIYKQEAPEKRMLYNQLSDQITIMKNSGIGLIMKYSLSNETEDFSETIHQLNKDCEDAKSQIESIYFKLSAFSESSFDPTPLMTFDGSCTPHAIEHRDPLDLLEKYSRKNEKSARDFITILHSSIFNN